VVEECEVSNKWFCKRISARSGHHTAFLRRNPFLWRESSAENFREKGLFSEGSATTDSRFCLCVSNQANGKRGALPQRLDVRAV
jgi:hypothetical protein